MAVKPKLAMIPSGVKAGKLYSVLPSDGTGDFTYFDRNLNTATRVNKDGLIEMVDADVPRLNYPLIDGVVSGCPSLLLEPSRTNLVPYSQAFDETDWVKSSSIVTGNQVISPDGTLNADLLETSVAGGGVADTFSGSGAYSFSVFAKYKDIQFIRLRSTNSYAWFDVKNGSVGTTISALDAKIEYYGNGWYRCTLVGNNTNTILQITCTEQNGLNVGFGGVYLWGAQFEASSFPTSYIPSLTGSQTTRSAETCNNSGDVNTFNDSEGVLMAEVSSLTEGGDGHRITLSDGSISDRLLIETDENANTIKFFIAGGGTSRLIATSTTQVQKKSNKLALNYNGTNAKAYINGFSIGKITNANTITGLNTLDLADWDAFTYPYFGKVKQLQYFDTALTDTDLEELTSWTSFNEMAESQLYSIQ